MGQQRWKALGTCDRALAEQRALPILAQWRDEERALLATGAVPQPVHAPTEAELEGAAVLYGYQPVIEYEDRRRGSMRGEGKDRWHFLQRRNAINLETQGQMAALGDDTIARTFADFAIEELGFDIEIGTVEYRKLCELINTARLDAMSVAQARGSGDVEADADSKLVKRVREREAAKANAGETIIELFERYAAEALAKGEKRPDTIEQDRKKIIQFADYVGRECAVSSVTALDVANYRDALRDLPPKWQVNAQLKGMGVRKAAEKARELGLPKTAFTTVNSHLSVISPLYKWLAGHPAWAGLVNPCNGLFYAKVKGKNRRPSLSTDTLNQILQSPLFKGYFADGKEHLPGDILADDWRNWIPLLAMFTGARMGELAQLRVGDVRTEKGVWFIHIRHDEQEGLSTKSAMSRAAVVHSILLQIGFMEFVERQRELASDHAAALLFPDLKPNGRGHMSAIPSRWWRKYLTKIGVKGRAADGVGGHSFRHTLADRLRSEAELLDDEIEVVLGHNQKTVTGGYGQLSQGTVNKFRQYLEGVRFEGVDFSHLVRRDIAGS